MPKGRAAAIGDKAVAIAGHGADLADLAAEIHRRHQRVRGAFGAAHDLEQFHHIGGREEMRAGDVLRALGRIGHDVDVDARSVREQQGAGLHRRVELFEHLLLDRDALEHRLDDNVGLSDIVVAADALDQPEPALHLDAREAAALDAGLVIAADAGETAGQRVLVDLEQFHRKAELGKAHGDAAAHRAGADDGRGFDRAQRRVARNVGQPRHLALGEEGIAQRARLSRVFQLVEQLAFAPHTFVERQSTGVFDRLNAVIGRLLAAGAARDRFAHRLKHARIGLRLGEPLVMVADARQRPGVGDAAGKRDRRLAQIGALGDQLIDDAEAFRLLRRHVATADDHVERRFRADQPRQPLGPAASGDDADQHFGQADLGARHGDAIVGGERDLESAAQRIAVDRGDHRLLAGVEGVVRALAQHRRRAVAEGADIGAGDKAAARADQHHRPNRRVGVAALDRLDDALGHPRATAR